MSKLLINEPPLIILPTLAEIIGLNQAIILQQIHYWMVLKTPDGRQMGKEVDGRRWIRNTAQDWQQTNFKFWSVNTVRRALEKLEKDKLLLTRNDLNAIGYDQTKWYTVNYEHLESIYPKWVNGINQNGQMELTKLGNTIPETTSKTTKIPFKATPASGEIPTPKIQPEPKDEEIEKLKDTKLYQKYSGFLRFKRPGDKIFKDPRLYHPAMRLYRGLFRQDVTPKANWRDRVIREVGEDKTSLETWKKSCEAWSGISGNPNAPARVLSIFKNGGVINDREDFRRQQMDASQDDDVARPSPILSIKTMTDKMASWQKLKDSGLLEKPLKSVKEEIANGQ